MWPKRKLFPIRRAGSRTGRLIWLAQPRRLTPMAVGVLAWVCLEPGPGDPAVCSAQAASPNELRLGSFSRTGHLSVEGTLTNGVCTVLAAEAATGPWRPAKNVFSLSPHTNLTMPMVGPSRFYRALAVELTPGRAGFTNLIESYGLLTTLAGAGGATDESNKWQPEFEHAPATNVLLSGPHIAMADAAGNIFIADKNAHAVRKVRPDGILVTVAGTNAPGDAPDDWSPATQVGLNWPNGLWVRPDGTVYILDLGNGKVRVLATNGLMRTLFSVPDGILIGRGLWVSADESLAYVACGMTVKKWTPTEGVTDYASGFIELGNLVVDPNGYLVVTDRSTHSVWRLFEDGSRERIAGNGTRSNSPGGGDGGLATLTGLDGVRGVWFLPNGGFFLCTHRGSQVWYVDPGGYIHLFLNGHRSETHAGDGTWFWNPYEYRVSECRAVTVDHEGNLLVTEHDAGYVRKVEFLRYAP